MGEGWRISSEEIDVRASGKVVQTVGDKIWQGIPLHCYMARVGRVY